MTAANTLISAIDRVATDANHLIARQLAVRAEFVGRQLQAEPGWRLAAGDSE